MEQNKNTILDKYIKENRELWASEDLLLWMNDLPISYDSHKWDCHTLFSKKVDNKVYTVFSKETQTNPKTVFYYWNGHPIKLNFFDAITFFTRMIKETYRWTSIFTKGDLLHSNIKERYYIWHQIYEPTKPILGKYLVEPRHLIGIYSVKILTESEYPIFYKNQKDIKIALISLRSLPEELVPIKLPSGEPQIIWHGAYLLISTCEHITYVHKFDSEDEGGWLFQSITDAAFPDYVQKEAIDTTSFIAKNKDYIASQLKSYESLNDKI